MSAANVSIVDPSKMDSEDKVFAVLKVLTKAVKDYDLSNKEIFSVLRMYAADKNLKVSSAFAPVNPIATSQRGLGGPKGSAKSNPRQVKKSLDQKILDIPEKDRNEKNPKFLQILIEKQIALIKDQGRAVPANDPAMLEKARLLNLKKATGSNRSVKSDKEKEQEQKAPGS